MTVDEGAGGTITAALLDYDDDASPDGAIIYTLTGLPTTGLLELNGVVLGLNDSFTQADINAGLVTFAHDGNDTTSDTFFFTVGDGEDLTGQSFDITITPVNDAPVLDLDFLEPGNDAAATWVLGNPPLALAPFATLDDDNDFFPGATLTIGFTAGGSTDDQLTILSVGTGPGEIEVTGSDISYEGTLVGSFTGGANGTDLVVSFNADACPCSVQMVMESIAFSNSALVPTTNQRTVEFTLVDGAGVDAGTGSAQVLLDVQLDGPPVVDDAAGTGFEDVPLASVTLVAHDGDGINPATFNLSNLPADGTLTDLFGTPIVDGVDYPAESYDSVAGVWTLTLYFTGDLDWSGDTSFDYVATDFDGNPSGTATATITLAPVPDAPLFDPEVNEQAVPVDIVANVSQTTGWEDGPIVLPVGGGDTLVVWQSGLLPSAIQAQLLDSTGAPVGSLIEVTASTGDNELQPAAAVQPDGSFAISWVVDGVGTGGGDIVTAFYAAGTTVPVATVTTSADPSRREADPAVTAVDGGYVVTWAVEAGATAEIHGQHYGADGTAVGAEMTFVTGAELGPGSGLSFDPPAHRVASVGTDSFVVVTEHPDGLHATLILADNTVMPLGVVNDPGVASQPVVAETADGGFVIVWRQDGGPGGEDLLARSYDSDGVPLGAPVAIAATTDAEFSPEVAALPDGRFVVAWLGNNGVDGTYDVYTQVFSADGTPASGGPLNVSNTGLNGSSQRIDEAQPTIAVNDDGTYTIGWLQNRATGGTAHDVFVQSFDPGPAAVTAEAGEFFYLPSTLALSDTDGSEQIVSIVITGLPAGFALDYGQRANGDPTSDWVIDRNDVDDALFLDDFVDGFDALGMAAPPEFTGQVTLQITAASAEIAEPLTVASTTISVPLNITPVFNEAPDVDLDFFEPGNDAAVTFFEGQGPVNLAYYATFDDDNAYWDGATLTVAVTGAGTGDQLTIENVGTGLGELSLSGSDLLYEGVVVGSWSGGANGNPLVITFNIDACACSVELTLASILYDNSDDITAAAARDVTFTFVDGDGTDNGGSDTSITHVALNVIPANDPPAVVPGADASGDEEAMIALTGISVSDSDADPATGLMTVHLSVAHGKLTILTDVPGGIDAAALTGGANGAAGIVITATADQINATLAAAGGLTYQGDLDFFGADALSVAAYDGTAASPVLLSSLGAEPLVDIRALEGGDIEGDGFGDFVFGFDGGVLVLSSGGGVYGLPIPYGAPSAFAFTDLDGDGLADIVFSSPGDGVDPGYLAYLSSDTGDAVQIAITPNAVDMAAGDFNGDGLTDFAVVDWDAGSVGVVLQSAPGSFLPVSYTVPTGFPATSISTGDFNRDGHLDLLIGYYGDATAAPPGGATLMLGRGDGSFADQVPVLVSASNVADILVADFNGDGLLDIAFASRDTAGDPGAVNGVQVALGNGGGFDAAVGYATTATGSPTEVKAADLNGDGVLDLVVANYDVPGSVSILVGNGDGSFQAPIDIDTGDLPALIAIADPDGDGDLDLVIGNADDAEAFNNDTPWRGTTEVKPIAVLGVNDAPVLGDPTDATIVKAVMGPVLPLMQGVTLSDPDSSLGFTGGGFTLSVSGTGGEIDLLALSGFGAAGAVLVDLGSGLALGTIAGLGTQSVTVSALTANATRDVLEDLLQAFGYQIDPNLKVAERTVTLSFDDGANGGPGALGDSVTQILIVPYNKIAGTNADNMITGTDWADDIRGRDGNDILDGGGGEDVLHGGLGNDVYIVSDPGDRAVEMVGEGNDVVRSSVTYSLAGQQVETLELTGSAAIDGTGNNLDNVLLGNAGVNQLKGGAGNDYYVIQNLADRVFEKDGEGHDAVLSSVSYALAGQFVEDLTLTGAGNITASGNSLDNEITGNAGANKLAGLGGNDVLDGGAGADKLYGGAGDDLYVIDDLGDRAYELGGEGHDTVESLVSYALAGQSIEDLILTGIANINGTGNSLDNAITGNAGANKLIGGLGDDTLTGGGGADSFYFNTAPGVGNVDTITDFEVGVDNILIDRSVLPAGLGVPLAGHAFWIGTAAHDANDRIVYDDVTGNLWFDADGSGAGAAVHFATLDAGLALQASDFTLFI